MPRIGKVLVVGGGVGGLSAAISLAIKGVEVELIEKRPDFNVPGVGLGQPACALRIYREFGVLEQILDTGFSYDHMTIFDQERTPIIEHRFLMGGAGFPAFCALPRASLHSILYKRAVFLGVSFRFGIEVTDFSGPLGVSIGFSDGSNGEFDAVAGFDGIRSTVRQFIVGDMFGPRPSGIGAWRLQVDRPSCVTGMEFMQGIRGKAGAIPISRDKMYLFNIRPENPGEIFAREDMHVLLQERLLQFGGYVADIANDLNRESSIVYGALEPFIVPYPWHRGRVTMGGDAAHVVPPHLTAGAAMAAEDGFVLARYLLGEHGTIDDLITAYGKTRYDRNAFVYIFANDWLSMEQAVGSAAELASRQRRTHPKCRQAHRSGRPHSRFI